MNLMHRRVLHLLCTPLWSVSLMALSFPCVAEDGIIYAIKSAATQNPQVSSKLAELRSLGFRVDEAKAGKYPSFSVEARTLDESSSKGLFRAQQPIWAFGRIDATIDVASSKEMLGKLELLELRRKLIEEVASTYASLYGIHERLKVSSQSIEELTTLQAMIQRRQEGGVASEADVRMANSRLMQLKLVKQQLLSQEEKLRYDLIALTSVPVSANLPIPLELVELPSRRSLAEQLENQHAGIQVRRSRLESVKSEVTLRKSELLPTLSFRVDRDISPANTSSQKSLRYGLVLEAKLEGGGFAGRSRLEAEAARVSAAQDDIDAIRLEARQRLDKLSAERSLQRDMLDAQEKVIASVRDTLSSFLRQYDAGRKSWVDVLNSQKELAEALQQKESIKTAWMDATLRIAALVGMLDKSAGVAE